MYQKRRLGFTLVEVLIVVVIMAILAATILPQFSDSSSDARVSTGKFNLAGLRAQLELYKQQHSSAYPTTLDLLTVKTNLDQSTSGTPIYGPYLLQIPEDGVTGSRAVATSTANPITISAGTTTGGWIYNNTTGEIRINHFDHRAL